MVIIFAILSRICHTRAGTRTATRTNTHEHARTSTHAPTHTHTPTRTHLFHVLGEDVVELHHHLIVDRLT